MTDPTEILTLTVPQLLRRRARETRTGIALSARAVAGWRDRLTYGQVFGSEVLMGGYNAVDGKLVVNMWSAQVDDPSANLERWMSFADVTSMQTCAPPSKLEAACTVDWLDWSQEFLPASP